jgi:hypothetical protein
MLSGVDVKVDDDDDDDDDEGEIDRLWFDNMVSNLVSICEMNANGFLLDDASTCIQEF